MPRSRKHGEYTRTASQPWDSSWPKLAESDRANEVWTYFKTRFGLPEKIPDRFVLRERRGVFWAQGKAETLDAEFKSLKVVSAGMPLVREVKGRFKPTSSALRLLGPWLSRNRMYLSEECLYFLLARGPLPCNRCTDGYVLLETDCGVLGCGLIAGGKLHSQIPKSETAPYLMNKP